jgi:hypothetical protein
LKQILRNIVLHATLVGLAANALGAPVQAHAQVEPSTTPTTVVSRDILYDVKSDGSYSIELAEIVRINNAQGVKAFSQINLSYNAARQEQKVIEAYVQVPGGARVDVPPSEIKTRIEDKNGNAPQFDPVTTTTFAIPGLVPGAEIHLKLLRTIGKAFLDGKFSVIEFFPRQTHFKHGSITLRAPLMMDLHAEATGLVGGRQKDLAEASGGKSGTGRQVWSWSLGEQMPEPAEPGSVSPLDGSARVTISSFASWEEAARSYEALRRPKAVVTPAIQQQADDITRGMQDQRAQAQALYSWVAANIKHVPVYLNFGGMVPHDAESVLLAKRGDSKDHNVVLTALLAAKGMAGSPALVNAGNSYWIPAVAAVPGQFNHVITWVPELSVYLDSTNELAPFGVLASNLLGKQALIVDDGTGKGSLTRLPVAGPWNDKVQEELRMIVSPDGSVEGRGQVSSSGVFEEFARQSLARVSQGAQSQIAGSVLKLSGQAGTGNYIYEDAKNIDKPFYYKTEFKLPEIVKLPGPGSFRVPEGLGSLSNIASTFEQTTPPKRTLAIQAHGRATVQVIRMALPETIKDLKLPARTSIESKFGHYESSVDFDLKPVLIVRRMLTLRTEGALISPEDYPEFRRFGLAVLQDMRTPIEFR